MRSSLWAAGLIAAVLTAIAGVMLIATPCSGDSSKPLTAQGYYARFSELFKEIDQRGGALAEKHGITPSDQELPVAFWGDSSALAAEYADKLGSMKPPLELAGAHNAYVAALRALSEAYQTLSQGADPATANTPFQHVVDTCNALGQLAKQLGAAFPQSC